MHISYIYIYIYIYIIYSKMPCFLPLVWLKRMMIRNRRSSNCMVFLTCQMWGRFGRLMGYAVSLEEPLLYVRLTLLSQVQHWSRIHVPGTFAMTPKAGTVKFHSSQGLSPSNLTQILCALCHIYRDIYIYYIISISKSF